jgi:8-oxo-dGTP diphosphatase
MSAESPAARLHVVAAVIRRNDGAILLSRRPAHVDQGDLWEFPGGKLHTGESRLQGLERELREELGLGIRRATPLLQVPHDYPTRQVLLDVFVVDAWDGEPLGLEGQTIRWVTPASLFDYDFPAANLPIVTAAQLPRVCVVTPPPGPDVADFLEALERCVARGARLVQLRAPALDLAQYRDVAAAALSRCRAAGARLLLNTEPSICEALGADGLHLNSRRLRACNTRPVPRRCLLSASCHDAAELAHARHIGVDFVFVSPVLPTASHPGVTTLGWDGLRALMSGLPLPAYALGGMGIDDCRQAVAAGCIGIAGIDRLWRGTRPLGDEGLQSALVGAS